VKEKSILWIVHEGSLSGANKCLIEWLKLLMELGYRQHLISPRFGPLTNELKKIGITNSEVYYYSKAINPLKKKPLLINFRQSLRNFIALKQIKRIAKSFKPDFIATNTITIDIGALAAKDLRVKHIWIAHEFGDKDHDFTFKKGIVENRKRMLDLSYKVAVISKTIGKDYEAINASKVHLLYNVVEIETKPQIQNEISRYSLIFNLLMLGQVTPGKGQLDAIKAIYKCKRKGVNVRLAIYGSTENESYLSEIVYYIKMNNLQHDIILNAPVSNIFPILKQSTALLVCSKFEAFGRVTVEALKTGIPVIAANSGGTKEIVEHGVNGLFYESGDVDDLSEKILQLKETYSTYYAQNIISNINQRFNAQISIAQLKSIFK
jgi:glycosyltransferase involved in cell wall biosynthesis